MFEFTFPVVNGTKTLFGVIYYFKSVDIGLILYLYCMQMESLINLFDSIVCLAQWGLGGPLSLALHFIVEKSPTE